MNWNNKYPGLLTGKPFAGFLLTLARVHPLAFRFRPSTEDSTNAINLLCFLVSPVLAAPPPFRQLKPLAQPCEQ